MEEDINFAVDLHTFLIEYSDQSNLPFLIKVWNSAQKYKDIGYDEGYRDCECPIEKEIEDDYDNETLLKTNPRLLTYTWLLILRKLEASISGIDVSDPYSKNVGKIIRAVNKEYNGYIEDIWNNLAK